MKKLFGFFKNVRRELKLVDWPSFEQVRESTVVVMVVSAFIAAFLTVVDVVFNTVVKYLM